MINNNTRHFSVFFKNKTKKNFKGDFFSSDTEPDFLAQPDPIQQT